MPTLTDIVLYFKIIGLRRAFLSLLNTLQHERLERKFTTPLYPEEPRLMGHVVEAQVKGWGARFQFEKAELEVRLLAPDLLFIAWDGAHMQPSYAVVERDWPETPFEWEAQENAWTLSTTALQLNLSREGTIKLTGGTGRQLRRDLPPWRFYQGWLLQTELAPEACLYGLGERTLGLKLDGGRYRMWNTDPSGEYRLGRDPIYITMPVGLCLQGGGSHLFFYDNTFEGQIQVDEQQLEARFAGGPLRYYLAVGSPAVLLDRFTRLTGRPALPPRWSLGYHQSRWGYRSEADLRRVYNGFRQHDLPISALYLDIDHMRGYRTLDTDPERYPTLAQFARELAGQDVHLVTSVSPGVKVERGFDLYEDGVKNDVFCKMPDGRRLPGVVWPGWVNFVDFTSPDARRWWGEQYARPLKLGIDGFWHDMNEPMNFLVWGERTLPSGTQHDLDGRGGEHLEAHNVYGLLMNQAAYEGLRRLRPDKRPFLLTRAGWVGMQRYCISWTGDIESTWDALQGTIPMVLGMGLCGASFTGPDIGGFTGHPSPELFVRWFQLSTFLPFFRTHCALFLPSREPWEWGEEVLAILRGLLKLRYRLLPYWYTTAWQASQTGAPMVRPMFWEEPNNRSRWMEMDTFYAGDDLLVAPALQLGQESCELRLPPGGWFELDTGRFHTGSALVNLASPLDRIPVLVRAGAILPMQEDGRLTLHLYHPVGGDLGRGQLYSDFGDGYEAWRLDRFTLQPAGKGGYELHCESQGDFPWPYGESELVMHGFEAEEIRLVGFPPARGDSLPNR